MNHLNRRVDELYGLPPNEFIAARDSLVAEARKAGDQAVASSLKTMRKPSVGAWLANRLARERTQDLDRLVTLGGRLRDATNSLDGDQIRAASKTKSEAIAALVREAQSIASRSGQPVSETAVVDLEGTLEAAFADSQAAASLRSGRLTNGLRYSGLGFAADSQTGPVSVAKGSAPPRHTTKSTGSERERLEAEREVVHAKRDAQRADAEVEKARQAELVAAEDLERLKSAAKLAVRRAKEAHQKATAAEQRLRRLHR